MKSSAVLNGLNVASNAASGYGGAMFIGNVDPTDRIELIDYTFASTLPISFHFQPARTFIHRHTAYTIAAKGALVIDGGNVDGNRSAEMTSEAIAVFNLAHQQPVDRFDLAVIAMKATSNRLKVLEPLAPRGVAALERARPVR